MRKQSGFSILEVLIAIVISMILLAGVLQIFINSKNIYNLETNFSDIQENGRFASSYVSRIIRLAGYRTPPVAAENFQTFSTTFPASGSFPVGAVITGTNGSGANGSDTISVRYQGSGNGTGTPDGTIRDCLNNAIDSNVSVTSTFSLTNNNELQCNNQILVSGVENMQVLYGQDMDGNGTADRYVPFGFSGLDMTQVVSVRVSLLLRSTDPVDLTPGSVTYYMLGQSYTPTATNYVRQQSTFTIVLRNLLASPE